MPVKLLKFDLISNITNNSENCLTQQEIENFFNMKKQNAMENSDVSKEQSDFVYPSDTD